MKIQSVTIRFPADLVQKAKQMKEDNKSFNELVVEALDKEVKRRKMMDAHQTILRVRSQVKQRTGVHPDPATLIRQLREENDHI
jgi:predicted CopG family antitoxin